MGELGDISGRIAETANRLRLVQMDFADEPEEVRRQYLQDTLARVMSDVLPEDRPAFLSELQELFPTWDARVELSPQVEESIGRSATDARELSDPSFLVSRLADLAPSLPAGDRRIIADRLREAGYATAGDAEWPVEMLERWRTQMQTSAEAAPELSRSLELLCMLAELALTLDKIVWSTWKTIAPRSDIRRKNSLRRDLAAFASGDGQIGSKQLAQDLEQLRQLTAAMISSVAKAGEQFGQHMARKLSPTEIEDLAKTSKRFMENIETACWRQYKTIASSVDQATIESDIIQSVTDYTESLMKGLGR